MDQSPSPSVPVYPAGCPSLVCKLPSFPPVATRLLQIFSQEDLEVADGVRLVRSDPAFAAEILQLANSPLYACPSKVSSISHAIVLIGIDRMKALAMTVALRSYIKRALKVSMMRDCWRHSLACALLAQDFAPEFGLRSEQAYTGGIVHDLGRLGLLAAYPDAYGPVLSASYDSCTDLLAKEEATFSVDHCQAGMWLAKTWGFPEELSRVAALHHDAESSREDKIVTVVRFACRLATAAGFGAVSYLQPATIEEIGAGAPEGVRVKLDPEQIQARIKSGIASLV
jgi:putative nucleotidyltransferase with HDIG domain